MNDKTHKLLTVIASVGGLAVALIGIYIAWDNHRDKDTKQQIAELDRQIKLLDLEKKLKERQKIS